MTFVTGMQHQDKRADENHRRPVFPVRSVALRTAVAAGAFDLDVVALGLEKILRSADLDRELMVRMRPVGVKIQEPRHDLDGLEMRAPDLRVILARHTGGGELALH